MRDRPERAGKEIIGWREWVALPDLGVTRIKVKVDTGARSSALHAFDVTTHRRRGREFARFTVHPIQRDTRTTAVVEAPLIDWRPVTSSSGRSELRPVVETRVGLLGEEWPIELTLTRRDVMGFRMLLGRQAVRGRYLVDPGRSYLGGRPKKKGEKVNAMRRKHVRTPEET